MVTNRRPLIFSALDQVMPEIDRLLQGHTTVGRWSLAQICNHLELAIRLPMDGVPVKSTWLVRRTVGPIFRRLSFRLAWIPEAVRVPEIYIPPPNLDQKHESDALGSTIERFCAFAGPLDEHPLLGRMTRPQWEQFHCLHCAHHLSFAIPTFPLA